MSGPDVPMIEQVQISYARILGAAVLAGFLLLFAGFTLYAAGILPSELPVSEVPELWHLSAEEYARETGREPGWAWVQEIAQGDKLAFAALVYFPMATLVLVFIAGLLFARNRVASYAIIAILEAIVLVVAATGVFA